MATSREKKQDAPLSKSLSPMASAYLKHLNLPIKPPSLDYLSALQQKHIETIPHENINGYYNLPTSFNLPDLLQKYIVENRGGMCFELNWSFAWLLNELGFKVEVILSKVNAYDFAKEDNPYPTHPIIVVHFADSAFLTDVGWSDAYRHPLALAGSEYQDQTGKYRVALINDNMIMQKWLHDRSAATPSWHDQFTFPKPKGPQTKLTFPPGFFASFAFTHVGPGYLFTNLFHFDKVHANGFNCIWGNRLKTRENSMKTDTELKQETSKAIEKDFKVATDVTKKMVKLTRSLSMHMLHRPVKEKELLERTDGKLKTRGYPF